MKDIYKRKNKIDLDLTVLGFFFLRFIYLQRERTWEGGAEGEKKNQANSSQNAEPYVGLDLKTLQSRPEPKPRV